MLRGKCTSVHIAGVVDTACLPLVMCLRFTLASRVRRVARGDIAIWGDACGSTCRGSAAQCFTAVRVALVAYSLARASLLRHIFHRTRLMHSLLCVLVACMWSAAGMSIHDASTDVVILQPPCKCFAVISPNTSAGRCGRLGKFRRRARRRRLSTAGCQRQERTSTQTQGSLRPHHTPCARCKCGALIFCLRCPAYTASYIYFDANHACVANARLPPWFR